MIPILYATEDEAIGGVWTEKKGTYQTRHYWNCEGTTAVLTSYSGAYTAYDAIPVTPGKLYHFHGQKGNSSKQKPVLFVDASNNIIAGYTGANGALDLDMIAPTGAVSALLTVNTINSAGLAGTSFKEFSTGGTITNGLGALTDCITAEVTEERNGIFELEFTYPVTGIHYSDIQVGRAVNATHNELGDLQPFIIYQVTTPMSGIITVCARHISYELSNVIIPPITATSVSDAFDQFQHKTMTPNRFEYWTDNTTSGTFTVKTPDSARALLGGQQGSILDVFGGEYEFDKLTVKNHASRGRDRGVTIRYGKNLTDLTDTTNNAGTYNAVVPYWTDGQNAVVYGGVVKAADVTTPKAVPLDLSNKFEDPPTVAALETAAASYLTSNTPWIPSENLKVDFIALWQTEEYKNIAPLERVWLCDTVHVIYPDLNVNATAQVIKVVWDVLAERYSSMELGRARASLGETIAAGVGNNLSATLRDYARTSFLSEAIDHATQLITGGLGGYIKFLYNADGEPTDMLVMDSDDITTAINILRINVNGIGFSSDGGSTYDSAWTLDGQFVADFITAGHLSCNRIQGGTLTLGGADNGNGVLRVYDASGNEIGSWTKDGIELKAGVLTATEIRSPVPTQGSEYQARLVPETGSINNFARGTFSIYSGYSAGTDKLTLWNEGIKGSGRLAIQGDSDSSIVMDYSAIAITNALSGHRSSITLRSDGDIWAQAANIWLNGQARIGVTSPPSYYSPVVMDSDGNLYRNLSTSSKRYKHDIKDVTEKSLDPKNLYGVKVIQYVYNDDVPVPEARKGKELIGFIAEQLAEQFPTAAIYGEGGNVESWEPFFIIPPMLALIQEQKKQLDAQEKRIKALEKKFEILMEALEENG